MVNSGGKFQSTHLHEVRRYDTSEGRRTEIFQSTHLHEVRPSFNLVLIQCHHFNPRTYMRCDSDVRCDQCHAGNFNPRTYMRCDSTRNEPRPSKAPEDQKCEPCKMAVSSIAKKRSKCYQPARGAWCEPPRKIMFAWGSHQTPAVIVTLLENHPKRQIP